jgi:hypothetical protein
MGQHASFSVGQSQDVGPVPAAKNGILLAAPTLVEGGGLTVLF